MIKAALFCEKNIWKSCTLPAARLVQLVYLGVLSSLQIDGLLIWVKNEYKKEIRGTKKRHHLSLSSSTTEAFGLKKAAIEYIRSLPKARDRQKAHQSLAEYPRQRREQEGDHLEYWQLGNFQNCLLKSQLVAEPLRLPVFLYFEWHYCLRLVHTHLVHCKGAA